MKRHNTTSHLAAVAASALALTGMSANAATVWNVNVGSINAGNTITTGDDYTGAATENTASSTWNSVTSAGATPLVDSTGVGTAGVTITLTAAGGSSFDIGGAGLTTGDEIFETWIKDNGNDDAFSVSFGNLNPTSTYDLVVYSEWFWAGSTALPVTQTAGTGLTGTFLINHRAGGTNGLVGALAEDTDPGNTVGPTNYASFTGLTSDGSNNLTFDMGGVNGALNGFQLVETIPEPSAAALLGLGGLALLRRRRK